MVQGTYWLALSSDLFQSNPELKEIMSEFGFAAKAAKEGILQEGEDNL